MAKEKRWYIEVFDGYEWNYTVKFSCNKVEIDESDKTVAYVDGMKVEFENEIQDIGEYSITSD